jgi:hypothetical protein
MAPPDNAPPPGLTAEQIAANDELADTMNGLFSGLQAAGADCTKATQVVKSVITRYHKLGGRLDTTPRTPEQAAWLQRRGRAKARRLHLRQPDLHCKDDPGYAAVAKEMPEDLGMMLMVVARMMPPLSVTDDMLDVGDNYAATLEELTKNLTAAGTDCAKGTEIIKAAGPAADKIAKRTDAFPNDEVTKNWFATSYMIVTIGVGATPVVVACNHDATFNAALRAYPLAKHLDLPADTH